jgi:hypothetical protein
VVASKRAIPIHELQLPALIAQQSPLDEDALGRGADLATRAMAGVCNKVN